MHRFSKLWLPAALIAAYVFAASAHAAQLSTDARGAIPHDVQQLVVLDYRTMQNYPAAMDLRDRVMPPELKQLEAALKHSGVNDNHDVDQLAFALYHPTSSQTSDLVRTVGVAQGQFSMQDITASFKKQGLKATKIRTNLIWPLGKTGMMVTFLDQSTMIFGSLDAVRNAVDARDGLVPSLLSNTTVLEAMNSVDASTLWSVLSQKGTQTMMHQIMGEASGQITDFETVRKRLVSSAYSMDFQHGVRFDLSIITGDTLAAATMSSLMNAAVIYKKMSGSDTEKQVAQDMSITSDSGRLGIHFASTDSDFSSLLSSSFFQSMVR